MEGALNVMEQDIYNKELSSSEKNIIRAFIKLDIYFLKGLNEDLEYSFDYKQEFIQKLEKNFKDLKENDVTSLVPFRQSSVYSLTNKIEKKEGLKYLTSSFKITVFFLIFRILFFNPSRHKLCTLQCMIL